MKQRRPSSGLGLLLSSGGRPSGGRRLSSGGRLSSGLLPSSGGRLSGVALCLALSGCVIGSGPCMWLNVKHTVSGHVHFREYPAADGIDNVPVLALDETEYVYAPAQSRQCLAANDVQLVGVSEFPDNVGENTHVSVKGSLFEAVAPHQHTQFLINVVTITPIRPPR